MEPRLGADLSAVRIHDDARSASLARTIHARAFAVGRDATMTVSIQSTTIVRACAGSSRQRHLDGTPWLHQASLQL